MYPIFSYMISPEGTHTPTKFSVLLLSGSASQKLLPVDSLQPMPCRFRNHVLMPEIRERQN